MSSLYNQPIVEDIISAFETTHSQSWSKFNDKLGRIPIKDCKKKDIFKSENPIELSDEDIPVFGLVPRLEQLKLVSCNKCSMIVKRDCIHYHYNRRHNNPENDNFSLERFILPTVKTNKHKKQKINVRKLPEKKLTDGSRNIDPVIQQIKTEFDELEFERLSQINQVAVKQENKIQYVDESDVNLALKSCNPSTSCGVFDWTLKPCDQSLVHYAVEDITTEPNEDFNKLLAVLPHEEEDLQSKKCSSITNNENTIGYITNSTKFSTKSLNSSKKIKPKLTIDFSLIMSDDDYIEGESDEDYDKNNINSKNEYRLQNNIGHSKFSKNNKYSNDSIFSNYDDTFSNYYRSSAESPNIKKEFLPVSKYPDFVSDEEEIEDISKIVFDQLPTNLLINEALTKISPKTEYLEFMRNKYSNNASSNSSDLTFSANKETELAQNKKYTVNINNESPKNGAKENTQFTQNNKYIINESLDDGDKETNQTQNNQYIDMNNVNLGNAVTIYDRSSTALLNITEESKSSITDYLSDAIDDDNCIDGSYKGYSLLYKGYRENLALLGIMSDGEEENDNDSFDEIELNEKENNEETSDEEASTEKYFDEEASDEEKNVEEASFIDDETYNFHGFNDLNPGGKNFSVSNFEFKSDDEVSDVTSEEENGCEENYVINENSKNSPTAVLDNKESKSFLISDYVSDEVDDENCYGNFYQGYYQLIKEYHKKLALLGIMSEEEEEESDEEENDANYFNEAELDEEENSEEYFNEVESDGEDNVVETSDEVELHREESDEEDYGDESSDEKNDGEYFDELELDEEESVDKENNITIENSKDYYNSFSYQIKNKEKKRKLELNHEYPNDINNECFDDSLTNYNHSQTVLLDKKEKLKSTLDIDYSDVTSDNDSTVKNGYYQLSLESELLNNKEQTALKQSFRKSNVNNSIINCNQSSLDTKKEMKPAAKDINPDFISDVNFNDTITNNDLSSQDIKKESKYTQTDVFLNHTNHKQFIDHITMVDESMIDALSAIDDETKCTQTDLSIECIDCYKTAEDLIDSYIPANSNVDILEDFINCYTPNHSNTHVAEYSGNNLTPNISKAQSINNTFIPTFVEDGELLNSDQCSSNKSHDLSSSIIKNNHCFEHEKSRCRSVSYTDKLKQEYILYHNAINKLIYLDKNYPICTDRLKTISDQIVYSKNCKIIPHANRHFEAKVKKNLKRRLGGQVADKENYNQWITGSFKKLKRVEFVVRKTTCSEESCNNDNVDE